MRDLLVRKTDRQRFFPDIEPELYRPNRSGEKSNDPGLKLLALAYPQLTWMQRYAGWHLSPNQQFARLLMLHRLAFEAELAGEFEQADFFWRETNAQLRAAWNRPDMWNAACAVLDHKPPVICAEVMRDLVAIELFIDTHIAFVNGQFANKMSLDPDNRAFIRLDFVRTLLELQKVPPAEAALLLAPGIEAEIAALQTAKRWDDAIARATQHLAMSPDDAKLQDRLALLHFDQAIDRLSGEGNELSDASWLGQKIEALEGLRPAIPDRTRTYSLLGQLNHLQSIRLANGGRLADALVAARKAQVFAPQLDDVVQTMSVLVDSMTKLQAQMEAVENQLRAAGNMRLSADGERLQSEARQGFSPLEQYLKSGQPEQIAAARHRASACALWQDIGLEQSSRPADEKLFKLLEVVGELYGSERTEVEDIAAAFCSTATANPEISELANSADLVAAFIVRRRRENAGESVTEQESPATGVDQAAVAAAFSIPVSANVVRPAREPLWFWLFGTQDRGYRVGAVAAGIAAIAVLGISASDWRGSHIRSQAYSAIMTAAGPEREKIVVAEAERFLGAWTLQGNDPRKAQVQALWRDALEVPNRRIRDTSFEQLRLAVQAANDGAALDAAERFLGAPPLQDADLRQEKVLDAYARAFSIWFANLAEPLGETAQARIQNYRKFASATPNTGKNP
jgi:hypothetical protein